MSVPSNRPYQLPLDPPPPREKTFSLMERMVFIFGFLLTVAIAFAFTPQIAKQIAYSWTIGVERAKAETARQFLNENPLTNQRIAWVAKAVAPSIVSVHVIATRPSEEFGIWRGGDGIVETDLGSGIIVDAKKGYVVTNCHVIENAHTISVRLSDGREIEAIEVGRDRVVDLAVLQIDSDDLESLDWGESQRVVVGEQVVAIGSPYGLSQTVTSGVISAVERQIGMLSTQRSRRNTRAIPPALLQTDAAINTGNSGGALVDMDGKLIGICTSIFTTENGGNSGIGFAIPSHIAKRTYEDIVLHGAVKHGWLGIELMAVTASESRQLNQRSPKGAVIRTFTRGYSPAKDAGFRSGDIILRWGELEIDNPLHLTHTITFTKPGTKETVEVYRKGELLTIEVTVGTRPSDL